MFNKISLSNIPMSDFQALEAMAKFHDRSMEEEALQALSSWIEPKPAQEDRSERRKEVAERLRLMLQQINASYYVGKLRPSHIAQKIGEELATEVEDWFNGNKEPKFSQLAAIAKKLGINEQWLQHGDGHIYHMEQIRLPEDAALAVSWLTSWKTDGTQQDTLKTLHLIRNKNTQGSFLIVKESASGHFVIYNTPIHVSEIIGAGGEKMLAYLFVTLELLYKRWTTSGATFHVAGYLVESDDFSLLVNGCTNPGALLRKNGVSMWWEDIWDRSMVEKHDYWPGWGSLSDRIERIIQAAGRPLELRQKIRSGELT